MTRTLATTRRFSKRINRPFGGYSAQNDPTQVGPTRALRAENVILLEGTVKKREGFGAFRGIWTKNLSFPVEPGQVHGMHIFFSDGGAGFQLGGPGGEGKFRTLGIVKLILHPDYTSSLFLLYDQLIPESEDGVDGWHAPFNSVEFDSVERSTDYMHVVEVGERQPTPIDNDSNLLAFSKVLFLLDGSERVFKTSVSGTRIHLVGLSAPTQLDSEALTDPSGDNHPQGAFAYKVTVANRALVPDEDVSGNPGPESNASKGSAVEVTQNDTLVRLTAFVPNVSLEPWTHVRVYRKQTFPVEAEESTYRIVGSFARNAILQDTDAGDGVVDSYVEATGFCSVLVTEAFSTPPISGTEGAYDFAPTRNGVPKKMHHFAQYRGRGFWANKKKRFVFYGDPEGPLTGGHVESLSGADFLEPLDGPVTMLAAFFDQLIIGTANSLYVHVGQVASHSNQTVAVGENIPPSGSSTNRIAVEAGPVLEGTGEHVVAGNLLYYISVNGMEAYDGQNVANVSKGIFQELKKLAIGDAASMQDLMKDAQLRHDPERRIIYFLVRLPLVYDEVPPGGAEQEAQYVKSRIWCYHYENRDPETGFGQWTQFSSIGPGASQSGFSFPDRRDRYSSISIRPVSPDGPRLVVATRQPESFSDAGGDYITHKRPVILEQRRDLFADEIDDGAFGGITWRWQSGFHDYGLIERAKRFFFLTSKIAILSDQNQSLILGFQVKEINGGGPEVVFNRMQNKSSLTVPVNRFGETISIIVGGDDSSIDSKLLGYAVDLEPLEHF